MAFSDISTNCSPSLLRSRDEASLPSDTALLMKSVAKEKYESSPLNPLMAS